MDLKKWAENEINLLLEEQKQNRKDELDDILSDYNSLCAKSALKAYNSLLEDNHSGGSWGLTTKILGRLCANMPLTPITEKDFIGNYDEHLSNDYVNVEQCNRMTSLFKYIDKKTGKVWYKDQDRVIGVDENGVEYGGKIPSFIINEKYPLTLPYIGEKYYVYTREIYDDASMVVKIVKPDGSIEELYELYRREEETISVDGEEKIAIKIVKVENCCREEPTSCSN